MFDFYIYFHISYLAGIQMRHGMMEVEMHRNQQIIHQIIMVVAEAAAVMIMAKQIHGNLMHPGIKDNKIMHTQPLQVIKSINCQLRKVVQ